MAGDDETTEPGEQKKKQKGRAKPTLDQVRESLLKAGYPLEMRVARAFQKYPLAHVVQGEVYRNTEGTFREIDVAAQFGVILGGRKFSNGEPAPLFIDLCVVCECKTNAKGNRPWIVFSDGTKDDAQYRITSHLGTPLGSLLIASLALDYDAQDLALFNSPEVVGYAATALRVFDDAEREKVPRENNKDPAYEAVMQVLDAAYAKSNAKESPYHVFRWVVPLIVLDADLYESWIDWRGELQLEARDEAALRVLRPGIGSTDAPIVYIVRESKLADFISRLSSLHDRMDQNEQFLLDAAEKEKSRLEAERRTAAKAGLVAKRRKAARRRLQERARKARKPRRP